jgi:AcrR family transcriptional regulator
MQTTVGGAQTRILDAMVQVVCERGYSGASVGLVAARAGVSRRTFYQQFAGLEECFAAVLDLGLTLPSALIAHAFAGERDWLDGVRVALAELLAFFDAEPGLTRCWFGEALAAGNWALEHRERNIAAVQGLIAERWLAPQSRERDAVLVRGVMSSVLDALTSHVVMRRAEPLITLLAPLVSLITSPFLPPKAVKVEVDRAEGLARKLLAERYHETLGPAGPFIALRAQATRAGASRGHTGRGDPGSTDPDLPPPVAIPALLRNPKATRARQCLRYLAQQGEEGLNPTNRQIATAIGVSTKGQMSKLLARLEGEELVVKKTHGTAWPNAWELTEYGRAVAAYFENHKSGTRT